MDRKNELLARVYLVMMFFIALSIWIVTKISYISLVEGEKWKNKISNNVKWFDIKGDRGSIYSADESILATSIPKFELRMDLLSSKEEVFNNHIDSLSYCIAKYINSEKSKDEWKRILVQGRKDGKTGKRKGMRYFLISRNLSFEQITKAKKFPIFNLGKIKGGIIIKRSTYREKPFGELASVTIGKDRKNSYNIGLEGAYDKNLKGETTKRLYKKLLGGTWIPVDENENTPLAKGSDLITNINIKIQDIVHHEVLNKLKELNNEAGVGIVMEVKTGKIVAITNLSKNSSGIYKERLNYAVKRKYAPGSVFKTATTIALLKEGFLDLDSKIDLENGRKNFRGKTIKDDEKIGNGGPVSLYQAFVHSSNVAMSKWADLYFNKNNKTRKQFIKDLKSFGLSQKSGIDLLGETKPVLKDPYLNIEDFYLNTIPWMAIGYETELTAIQLLKFYNAIANDGKIVQPYLVDKILEENNIIDKRPKNAKRYIADLNNINKIKKLLKGVIIEGTGQKLKKNQISIAGKTGTAQANVASKIEEKIFNSTFVGYFPAEHPKYSMIIVMYGAKWPHYYASDIALPVFGKIVQKMQAIRALDFIVHKKNNSQFVNASLPENSKGYGNDFEELMNMMDIPFKKKKKTNWTKLNKKINQMELNEFQLSRKTIPDFREMGLRDAIYLAENLGLKVEFRGTGKVYTQSLAPGTKIKGQKIKFELK